MSNGRKNFLYRIWNLKIGACLEFGFCFLEFSQGCNQDYKLQKI